MEKRAIGFKKNIGIVPSALMILGGIVIIIASVFMFVFVIGGAIGGAIVGGVGTGAVAMIGYPIKIRSIPNELVFIDANNVYFQNAIIMFSQIRMAEAKGKKLLITPIDGQTMVHGFIDNSEECARIIVQEVQEFFAKNQRQEQGQPNQF